MEKRNGKKRKIIILCVIAAVILIAVIVALAVLLIRAKGKSSESVSKREAINLEDVLTGSLAAGGFNATWVSGEELIYGDTSSNIVLYNVRTSTKQTLFYSNDSFSSSVIAYGLSPDRNYILLAHDYQPLFRYSFLAKYTVVNVKTQEKIAVNVSEEENLQLAKWGPVGNSLVFVMKNNIYFRESVDSTEDIIITTDGLMGNIYNGVPDWVYEEEVFSSNKALWMSKDGTKIAYGKFDDRNVPIMTIPLYGQPGNLLFQYTKAVQIRYPKTGTTNPTVTLHVYNIRNNSTLTLSPPASLSNVDHILAVVSWITNSTLLAVWMNRIQNNAFIVSYTISESSATPQTITVLNQTEGWVELFTEPKFSSDGSKMAIIWSQDQGDAGSYRHVTVYDVGQTSNGEALTSGNHVVTEILSWDSTDNLIYYTSTLDEDPGQQHLYSVSTTSKETKCISCNLTNPLSSSECLFSSAGFSTDNSYYAFQCKGPDVPVVTLRTKNHQDVTVWNDNRDIYEAVQSKSMPTTQRMTFEVGNGFKARVMLTIPPDIDTSGNTKYPMVVHVYAGPDSYQCIERYNVDWGSYLASNKSIIYAMIDGRGSGLKGDEMLFSIYKRMGTVEVEDQINVTRQIQETLSYVDSSRTAIWGWSYGGFVSGMALATDTEGVFKCGISVAPVTDWLLYDSIYTERYMGLPTPDDNYNGYHTAQLLSRYEGLRDKSYFLIHGTLDDNVHYQQSMLWAKVLEQQDILFRQMSYPDESHGLATVRPHLYHSLERFLDECFEITS